MAANASDGTAGEVAPEDLLDTRLAGSRAIRGGGVRVAGFAVTVLMSVVSSALLFRHLGPGVTGDYVKVVSLVTLCGGFTDAGLSAIGVRELATRDEEGRRALMRALSGLRLLLATLGVALAVAFAAVAGYGGRLVAGAAIVGVAMILTVMQDTYAINLTAKLRIGWVAAGDLLRVGVLATAIVALVLAGAGLLPFYAASVPAALASAILLGALVRHEVPLLPTFRPRAWRGLLHDTLSYALATAVTAVYFRVAIVVVSLVTSSRQTGYFSVSFRVIEVLVSVPGLLVGVAFPIFARAAREDRARLEYAVGRVTDALWILGLGVVLVLVVGAPFLIAVVGGVHFRPSVGVLRIEGLATVATFVGACWGYALLSLNRLREILLASLLALALTIVLNSILATSGGARGAAVATMASEYVFVAALGFALYSSGLRPTISWRAVSRSLIAVGLGFATLAIPAVPDIARIALALVVYGGGLVVLRAVPQELIAELPWRFAR
jgi:O-antigen/teichoic acid export membrane protein